MNLKYLEHSHKVLSQQVNNLSTDLVSMKFNLTEFKDLLMELHRNSEKHPRDNIFESWTESRNIHNPICQAPEIPTSGKLPNLRNPRHYVHTSEYLEPCIQHSHSP